MIAIVRLPLRSRPGLVARGGSTLGQVQQLLDVIEGEPELLGALDKPHHPHRVRGVGPIPRPGPRGFGQQTAAFLVPQGLGLDLGLCGDLARPHPTSMNPVPRYQVKLDTPRGYTLAAHA